MHSIDPVYASYLLLGLGTLTPWNTVITAADYFGERYPGYHVDRLFTIFYLPVNLIVLAFFIHIHDHVKQRLRIVAGLVAFTAAVLAMPLIDIFPSGLVTLSCVLLLVAACGAADGAAQGALFGEAAALDPRYTQALVAGTAISGVVVSFLRISTKAILPDTPQGLRASANLYFFLAALTCAGCVVVYCFVLPKLMRQRSVIFYNGGGDGGSSSSSSASILTYNPASGGGGSHGAAVFDEEDPLQLSTKQEEEKFSAFPPFQQQQQREDEEEVVGLTAAAAATSPPQQQPLNNTVPTTTTTYMDVAWRVKTEAATLVIIYTVSLSIFPGVLAEDVSSGTLGSWYPVLLIFVFNLGDCAGKFMPVLPRFQLTITRAKGSWLLGWAVCRAVFIPAFYFAATRGAGGVVIGVLTVLLGLSNGYLTSTTMMEGPAKFSKEEPFVAVMLCGNIMVLSLILGLCIGAGCGFLWLL